MKMMKFIAFILLTSWLLANVCCDVTVAGDKLRDIFQQLENQGLHLPEIEVGIGCFDSNTMSVLYRTHHCAWIRLKRLTMSRMFGRYLFTGHNSKHKY